MQVRSSTWPSSGGSPDHVRRAHCVHLGTDDIAAFGREGRRRAPPDVEPAARSRNRAGHPSSLQAGAPVGLGVDGSASNERSDLFFEVKQALLVARGRGGPRAMMTVPRCSPARDARKRRCSRPRRHRSARPREAGRHRRAEEQTASSSAGRRPTRSQGSSSRRRTGSTASTSGGRASCATATSPERTRTKSPASTDSRPLSSFDGARHGKDAGCCENPEPLP